MNLMHILDEVGQHDPEIYERLNPRRSVLKHFSGIGRRLSLTALPFALGAMFKKAYDKPVPLPCWRYSIIRSLRNIWKWNYIQKPWPVLP